MGPHDDPERAQLREATRGFLGRHFPLAGVRERLEQPRALDRERWRAAAEMGWVATVCPVEHGGLDAEPDDLVLIAEELGRALHDGPFPGCVLSANALARAGAVEHGELLRALADGETTAAFCVVEADAWEPGDVTLAPAPDGRLTGVKRYVLDADLADALVVAVRVDGELALAVVPADAPGVEIVTARGLDLTRPTSTVRFTDVPIATVPAGDAVHDSLRLGAVLMAADALGGAQHLFGETVAYALQRTTFGRPIASYQVIKHKAADMLCGLEGARVATAHAAASLRSPGSDHAVSVAKSYVSDACSRLAGESLQIFGGVAFTWEHELHLYLRRAKADEVLFGSPRHHRAKLGVLAGLAPDRGRKDA